VSEPTVVMKLWEQLLVRERGLNEREDALLDREHGMVEAKCALGGGGGVHVECDAIHDQATTIRENYRARVHASTTSQRHFL
jgi:hypothetical protein